MNRKSFLRNVLMAAAISVLPKNLLPSFGEVEAEQEFIGIIPYIEKYGNVIDVHTYGSFSMKILEELIDGLNNKNTL